MLRRLKHHSGWLVNWLGGGYRAAASRVRRAACILAVAAALALAPVHAAPAYAQSPVSPPASEAISVDQIDARWGAMTFVQRAAVINQLIQLAEYDRADRLLAPLSPKSQAEQLDTRFLRGLLRKGQGQTEEAAAIFREILASHPNAGRARAELAQTLFIRQEDESARHHFDLLLGSGNAQADQITQSYINAIEARRRWNFTSYVTMAPSSNLNQGAKNRNIGEFMGLNGQLGDRNVKKAGVGLAGGAQAGYRQPLTESVDLMMSAGLNGRRYSDSRFDAHTGSVSIGPRVRTAWGYIGLYGLADKSWAADEAHNASFGGHFSTLVRLAPGNLLYSDLVCSKRRFSPDWDDTDLSHQDGRVCTVSNRLEHHLTSSSFISVIARAGLEKTETPHLDNRNWTGGLGYYRELPFGISVYSQLLLSQSQYAGKYPTFEHARQDKRVEVSAQLTKRDWQIMGLAPSLQYTYSRNFSNIDFLSFDAHGVNVTLTKKF